MKNHLLLVLLLLFGLSACTPDYANRNPSGEVFSQVKGESLEQLDVKLPDALLGKPALLLVGYKQDSQFDIDRWLIGLDMTETAIAVYEIPTIPGLAPRMFQTYINDGMRAGIPKELWGGVITVYEGGDKIQEQTGTQNPNNARVMLLNAEAEIVFFYDRGFSVDALNRLRDAIDGL